MLDVDVVLQDGLQEVVTEVGNVGQVQGPQVFKLEVLETLVGEVDLVQAEVGEVTETVDPGRVGQHPPLQDPGHDGGDVVVDLASLAVESPVSEVALLIANDDQLGQVTVVPDQGPDGPISHALLGLQGDLSECVQALEEVD